MSDTESKRHLKSTLLGLLTIIMLSVVVRWNVSLYPVQNPDAFANASVALTIGKFGFIPFLLHPVLSFLGIYPGSDTAGVMITEAGLFALVPTPTMMYTNTVITLIIGVLISIGAFLLGKIFIKNSLCQFIPPIALSSLPYLFRETQWYVTGARGLAFAFLLLFFVGMFKVFMIRERNLRIRWLVLAMIFAIGGICSHLMVLYYFPFVVIPMLLAVPLKKIFPYIARLNPLLQISQKIKKEYLMVGFMAFLYIIPFSGLTVFPYSARLPQIMRFQFIAIGENVYIAFVWTYIMYYGVLFMIGLFGILALSLDIKNTPKQVLFIALIFVSQVYIDLTYFLIIFFVFLAILGGLAVEFVFKKNNLWLNLTFVIFASVALAVALVYIYRYQYIEFGVIGGITLMVCFYIGLKIQKMVNRSKTKTVVAMIVAFSIIISPVFGFCVYNYDFSLRVKNDFSSTVFQPTARADYTTEGNAFFLKYSDEREAVVNHAPFYGAYVNIAGRHSTDSWVSLMHFENVRNNVQISSVEWSISAPKTFFTGTVTLNNRSFSFNTHFNWLIFQSSFHEGRNLAHAVDVYYLSEFLPCEGKFYHTFPPHKFFDSILLKTKGNYAYCVYQNTYYATYYF